MLTDPGISGDTIAERLRESYGLAIAQVSFLPLGYVDSAVYRVASADGVPYFLKLRRGDFNPVAVDLPAFLHAHGIRQVMAPIATRAGPLWVHAHGFDWILYPYFEGQTGFERALSKAHWVALGHSLKAIHATSLPAALAARVPQEAYSPRWREAVKAFHQQVRHQRYADPIAARFAAFWQSRRHEIKRIVERAEQLAQVMQQRPAELVVCHSDLHGRNVLIDADDLTIVDWDEPILAPKERDLMFVGGGVGGIWNREGEAGWFYEGYGQAEIDLIALSYYRYERIVVDIAEDAKLIFGMRASVSDREKALLLSNQFLPNNVVDIADRTYRRLG
jgi:spectinomycin phosphotransferase